MKRSEKIVLISILTTFLLSLLKYSNNIDNWYVDVLSHFAFQYLNVAAIILLISIWLKRTSFIILSLLLVMFNYCTLIGFSGNIQASVKDSGDLKVYSANVSRNNKHYDKLRQSIRMLDAEIVVLFEVTPEHLSQLRPVIQEYPYHYDFTPVGSLDLGVVVMSAFPFAHLSSKQLSEEGNALVEVILDINSTEVTLYALHSQNPLHKKDFQSRKEQLISLAEKISKSSLPVIVAGDLNATPYSPIFRKFMEISRLSDSSDEFGWQPSWPTFFTFAGLPIDHILVSPEIQTYKRTIGPEIGSDHYPVIAEISI